MVDLQVLTSLEKLLFILKILFILCKKQATLMRRSIVLCFLLQVSVPCLITIVRYSVKTPTVFIVGDAEIHLMLFLIIISEVKHILSVCRFRRSGCQSNH